MLAGQVLRDLLAVNWERVSLLLVEELAEGLPQQVVDLPVTEKGIVGAHQLQLLLVLNLDVGALNLQSSRLEHLRALVVCVLPSC